MSESEQTSYLNFKTALLGGGSLVIAGAGYYLINWLYDPYVANQEKMPDSVLHLFNYYSWKGQVDRSSFKKILRVPLSHWVAHAVKSSIRNALSPQPDNLALSLNLSSSQLLTDNPWLDEYLEQLDNALDQLHVDVPDHFLDACLRLFDGNHDGSISKFEFVTTYLKLTTGKPSSRLAAVFALLDEDNSYGISAIELAQVADDVASLVHSLATEVLQEVSAVSSKVLMHHIVKQVRVEDPNYLYNEILSNLKNKDPNSLRAHHIPRVTLEIPRSGLYKLMLAVAGALPRDDISMFMCRFVRDEVLLEQQFTLMAKSGEINSDQFFDLMKTWIDFEKLADAILDSVLPAHAEEHEGLSKHVRTEFPVRRFCDLLFRVLDSNADQELSWHEISLLMELYEPTASAFVGDDLTKSYSGSALAAANKNSGLELTNRFMEVVSGRQMVSDHINPSPVETFFHNLFEIFCLCVEAPLRAATDAESRRSHLPHLISNWFKHHSGDSDEMTVEEFSRAVGEETLELLNALKR